MKAIILLSIIFMSFQNIANAQSIQVENRIVQPPNIPGHQNEEPVQQFEFSANLAGSECFTANRLNDACNVIMIPQMENLKVELSPNQFQCSSGGDNDGTNNNSVCEPTLYQGDWLKSIYLGNQRYIGIVTIQKLIDVTNKNVIFYQAIVEILGKGKTIARMSTTFHDINQVPHASLEAPEIVEESIGGLKTTKISLTIARPQIIETRPNPIPNPELPGTAIQSHRQNKKLPKVQWKVEKGNLILR